MKILDLFRNGKKDILTYDLSEASNGLTQEIMTNYNKHRPIGPQPLICYSPSKNIYFGHNGKVITCCYNRDYLLGKYPEQTIKEIWFGEKAQQLRDYIAKNDLSHGCFGCLSQLVAENFEATKSKQYDERTLNGNLFPSVMEFELDNTCNLECVMCSGDFSSLIRKNREKRAPLETPYGPGFLDQLKEFIPFLDEVKFYGGEPFLVEIYYDIMELIIKINPAVRISIQTNCTVLNNRVKSILSMANVHLNLSIDSLEKNNYESIRVNANFDRVMENLEYFHQYAREKRTFLGVSACAMRQNWHELPNFVRFCNKLNVPVYFHTIFYPVAMSLHSLGAAEIRAIAVQLESELPTLPETTLIEMKNKRHILDMIKQLLSWENKTANFDQKVLYWHDLLDNIHTFREFIAIAESQTDKVPVNKRNDVANLNAELIPKLKKLEMLASADNDQKKYISLIKTHVVRRIREQPADNPLVLIMEEMNMLAPEVLYVEFKSAVAQLGMAD